MKTIAVCVLVACAGVLAGCDGGDVPAKDSKPAFEIVADVSDGSAVGTARNNWTTQLRKVLIQFSVYDSGGAKLGTATAFIASVEPGETWKFKAHSFDREASQFRFDGIQCSYGGLPNDFQWASKLREAQRTAEAETKSIEDAKRYQQGQADRARREIEMLEAAEKRAKAEALRLDSAKFRGVKLRAESGSAAAMAELAELYRTGAGTEVDEDAAERWRLRAEAAKEEASK